MTRGAFLRLSAGAVAGSAAVYGAEESVREVFSAMAAALAGGDASEFIRQFEPSMPSIAVLRSNVEALVEQADVVSSIDFVGERDEEPGKLVQADWAMTVQSRGASGTTERRRQVLTVRLHKVGKGWKITSLQPIEFFAAPQLP